jgi:hypothetical protein
MRCFCMAESLHSRTGDWELPLLTFVLAILGILAATGMLMYWLDKPAVRPNPGMAAYQPPPGVRLIPLPRKMDAHELATVALEPSPLTALAQEYEKNPEKAEKPKRESRVRPRKAQRSARREYQYPVYGYAQPWNGGNHQWTGGSRSLF